MRPTLRTAPTTVAVSAALLAGGLAVAPSATADDLTPKSSFTMPVDETTGNVTPPASGADIPNMDSVKATIRAYYNVPTASGDPDRYTANRTTSPYLTEVAGIESTLSDLPPAPSGTKAVVFDVDDTLLWNYDFEDKATSFIFNGDANAEWVRDKRFPAVPGMPEVVRGLVDEGYKIYAVTGRPSYQEADTIANLTQQGFTTTEGGSTGLFDADNTYTKWGTNATAGKPDTYNPAEVPDYVKPANGGECTTHVGTDPTSFKCTTVEYKAQTRKHIEDQAGVEIVANVGDQLSDLWGGYADQAYKIPNPTYFLGSPDLDAAHRGDDDQADDLTLPDDYTMQPDGSSGTTVEGDAIPNIDPVRNEIRAYYKATGGIADKTSSNYITEVTGLADTWTSEITTSCQKAAVAHRAAGMKIARARARSASEKRAIARASKAVAAAQRAYLRARRHHQPRRAHRALHDKHVAAAAKRDHQRAKAAADRTVRTTKVPGTPAVVLDADDTTLWTYDMEDGAMAFAFDPTVQDRDWVQPQRFPAVPGMPELVANVADAGCTIIGLTGRSDSQKYATLGNLQKAGYSDFRANNYYTKWNTGATPPAYVDCAGDGNPACSVVEYKSGTRRMLETQRHLRIVANLGDQFSDLIGGHAEKTYKLPNPTYYLP